MKGFAEKLQRIFMAAAFAEAGEYETAREVMRERDTDRQKSVRLSVPQSRAQQKRP
jgi:hypothetical protein